MKNEKIEKGMENVSLKYRRNERKLIGRPHKYIWFIRSTSALMCTFCAGQTQCYFFLSYCVCVNRVDKYDEYDEEGRRFVHVCVYIARDEVVAWKALVILVCAM